MKALVYQGPGSIVWQERPAPRVQKPTDAVVKIETTTICGTDLHIWLGEYDSVPPVTMGHEVCGTVAELGEGVDAEWSGARVAVETFFSTCGRCARTSRISR